MNKLKELLTKLTTGKNKKFFYIGLGLILVLIIFLSLNKQSSLKRKNTEKEQERIGNEYVGVKEDEGLRYSSFNIENITYNDADYGNITISIKGQLYYRENHDKSYYIQHPYDKKTISNQIKTYIETVITEIINESENIKYNQLRNIINNDTIASKIKDQVSNLDFTYDKVEIYSFALSKESLDIIKQIEISKRPQVPSVEQPNVSTNPELE